MKVRKKKGPAFSNRCDDESNRAQFSLIGLDHWTTLSGKMKLYVNLDPEPRIVYWAQAIGQHTARLFERILADKPPGDGLRSCLGIISARRSVLTGSCGSRGGTAATYWSVSLSDSRCGALRVGLWQDRQKHRHEKCRAIITRIGKEGALKSGLATDTATDLLWTITSLRTWEELVLESGWTAAQYRERLTHLLVDALFERTRTH